MLTLDDLNIIQDDFRLSAGFAVPMGTTTAILGPSGAGKSTLLSVIGGFFAPTSGRVTWEGRDLTAMPPAKRPMAHLFQDNNLFPHMTAAQNVGLGIKPTLRLSPADKRAVQELWRPRVWGIWAIAVRRSFRAGSNRAWRSRGCWCNVSRLCCSMSRSRHSDRPCARI